MAQAANLNFNGAAVAGCSIAGSNYTCATFNLLATDRVLIASGYNVSVGAPVAFSYNQGLTMSGTAALTVKGNLDIGDINPSNLSIGGGALTATDGTFKMGAQQQTIVADITAAAIKIGTGSNSKVTGTLSASGNIDIASHATVVGAISGANVSTASPVALSGNVSASGTFTLASGSTLAGSVSAATVNINASNSTVNGNITATGSATVGSGNTVNGNLVSPIVTIDSSSVEVNGNVTAKTSLSMGSGDAISGDVEAGKVTLASSESYIGGNAKVDSIVLNWHGRVYKTITCNAPAPGAPCSCVTNNSGYDANTTPKGPSCGPPPAVPGPHHILISHPGTALTCQPQTVSVTACANAACSVPHYTGGANVTLTPGGKVFATGSTGVNGAATVQQTTAGTVVLAAASNPAAPYAVTCVNTANPNAVNQCAMVFSDNGLQVTVPNHLSDSAAPVTVSALRNPGNNKACVPLFAGITKDIVFGCTYSNPASGTLHARFGNVDTAIPSDTAGACAANSGIKTALAFDANGTATAWMKYADVGEIDVNASYTAPSGDPYSGLVMNGSDRVIVAPASFSFDSVLDAVNGTKSGVLSNAGPGSAVFTKAGKAFWAKLSARNSSGNITQNFGREATPQSVVPGSTLSLPSGGNPGALSGGTNWSFSGGSASAADLAWSEVGIMKLTATLSNSNGYLGSAAAPTNDVNGNKLIASGASQNIGRFVPDHFDTAILAAGTSIPGAETPVAPMDCGSPGATDPMTLDCGGGEAGFAGFAYSKQAFGVQVIARNANNLTTMNYAGTGGFARDIKLTAWQAAGGGLPATGGDPGYGEKTGVALGLATFTQGESKTAQSYNLAQVDSKPGPPAKVFLRAIDTDGVSSLRDPAGAPPGKEGGLTIVSGRMLIPNNYGSELLPMTINLQAQVWNTKGAWVANIMDSASKVIRSTLIMDKCKKNLRVSVDSTACKAALAVTPATGTQVAFAKGLVTLKLGAPGAGNTGSAELHFQQATNPSSLYLPSTTGQATFGIYKSGPVIYLRELY